MIKSFSELGRYRIEIDESWEHEKNRKPEDKIWHEQIPLQNKTGFIYLKNPNTCVVYISTMGTFNNRRDDLTVAGITYTSEKLDGEGLIYFGINDLKKVGKILKARMRRKPMTEEQRQKAIEILKPFMFSQQINSQKKVVDE